MLFVTQVLGSFPVALGRLSLITDLYQAFVESKPRLFIISFILCCILWGFIGEPLLLTAQFAYHHTEGRFVIPGEV